MTGSWALLMMRLSFGPEQVDQIDRRIPPTLQESTHDPSFL